MNNSIQMKVNGRDVQDEVEPRVLLVEFLRKNLQLTGPHMGCETTQCGACIVHLDGRAVKSCTMLAVQADGHEVITIEGIAPSDKHLHPMQEAFKVHHGLQCGFCTSGMVMMGLDIARRLGVPDDDTIREELKGNICRCTGYHNIVKAIGAGVKQIAQESEGRAN